MPPRSSPAQVPKGINGAVGVTRMRSKTAHALGAASTTASIRPSSSSYYAAQVRKLEEESIRFASGYDRLDTTAFKANDRHQSSPVPSKNSPFLNRASMRPSLSDIQAGLQSNHQDVSFGSDDSTDLNQQQEADIRREQRDLVFGSSSPSGSIPKSASGPLLSAESRLSTQEAVRRRKKSISLDPKAANAVMGSPHHRDPGSPGFLIQSASYNAISNMNGNNQLLNLKQHSRYSSDKDIPNNKADVASPASSRSSTPVQGGIRKSTLSDQPMREKLELWESDTLTATFVC